MKKYDTIVVGSGISGMTMALLLTLNGQKVMLLEKNPRIGGSMARFYRGKVPFDVGFHFTGGLQERGILYNLLSILGLKDLVEPIFLNEECASCFIFEQDEKIYTLPYGVENVIDRIKSYFPDETGAIDKYFEMVRRVCANTPSLNLESFTLDHQRLDEDYVTLDDALKKLTPDPRLRGLLSGYAMCYGVKPSEVSFADHSRMCLNFYESLAYVKGGGDGLIGAFKKRFKELGVDVSCGKEIVKLEEIRNDRVGRFVLSTGEEVTAKNCIFTTHPHEILKVLPAAFVKKAFINRVMSFEPSVGFFSLFATLDQEVEHSGMDATIVMAYPHHDVNRQFDPGYKSEPGLVVIRSVEGPCDGGLIPLHLLEPAFPEDTAPWAESGIGKRPSGYRSYKKEKTQSIMEHFYCIFPEYRGHVNVADSASMLTFRDYLNSPDGSAYGIKQKAGQFNLVGKLPLKNLHAAGQSAVLPGIIGAMISSFIVGRTLAGKDQYERFLSPFYAIK